jgi:hypothetical protein
MKDYDLKRRFTARQMACLIKIQAHIRGFLARKKIKAMHMNAGIGMGGYTYNPNGEIELNYDNPQVQNIREELGDFVFDQDMNNMGNLEFKPMVQLDNHARYEGEWLRGTDTR